MRIFVNYRIFDSCWRQNSSKQDHITTKISWYSNRFYKHINFTNILLNYHVFDSCWRQVSYALNIVLRIVLSNLSDLWSLKLDFFFCTFGNLSDHRSLKLDVTRLALKDNGRMKKSIHG